MIKSQPKKHLRPSPENRDETVALITESLLQNDDEYIKSLSADTAIAYEDIRQSKPAQLCVGLGFVFMSSMGLAVNRVLKHDLTGWQQLQCTLQQMYWSCEIQQHDWIKNNVPFDNPSACEIPQIVFHAVSLATGYEKAADWIANFLHNHFYQNGIAAGVGYANSDFLEFYWRLLLAQTSGKWVPMDKLSDELGAFRPLLETAHNPIEFEKALKSYCDFRLSRSFQFENQLAQKPRKAHDGMYLFEQRWLAIFPFELLALQAIYEKTTGAKLSLKIDHPLLQTPLLNLPAPIESTEDDLTRAIRLFGENYFNKYWQPLNKIELLD